MNAISFIRRGGTIMGTFKTKIAVTTLLIVFVIALFPGIKLKAATSGTCGLYATWTLDDEGTLTIACNEEFGYIDCKAFENNTDITKVVIGQGISSIHDEAFMNCKNLKSVTISDGLDHIGSGAFSQCTSLTSVTIPNSVTEMGVAAFSECTSLVSITIPNSVTEISGSTFSECTSLKSVTIPNSVTKIDLGAFSQCTSLTSITIPNSVTSIGRYAFDRCEGLTSVTIPNSVTSIGDNAFLGCTSLTSITIRKSLYEQYQDAFPNISSDAFHFYTEYEITFKNYDGTVLEKKKVLEGEIPEYTGTITPEKPSAGGYSYEFKGWEPELAAVTGPATYTATYTRKEIEYKVTFVDYDGVEICSDTVKYHEVPVFNGNTTPVRKETDTHKFTFAGWTDGKTTYSLDQGLPQIESDTTFSPVFDPVVKPVYTVGEVKGDGINSDIVIDVHRNVDDENCLTYFLGATIDGTEMKVNDQYTATKGSTIITIKKDFLSTLSSGEHEVIVNFNDGSISTKVTIAAQAYTSTFDRRSYGTCSIYRFSFCSSSMCMRRRNRTS